MKNPLQTIQTISKLGKILSKVTMVFSIVAACFCLIGIISLAAMGDSVLKLGDVSIHGILKLEESVDKGGLYYAMIKAMILTIGEAVVAGFAGHYFDHELSAGTPFTFDGAKEMFRLGILAAAIPIGCTAIAEIIGAIIEQINSATYAYEMSADSSVTIGILFIVASFIFRYGAEILQNQKA